MARRSGILKDTINEEEVKAQNEFSDTPEAQDRQEILAGVLGLTPVGIGAATATKAISLLPKIARAMKSQAKGTAALEGVLQYPKVYSAFAGDLEKEEENRVTKRSKGGSVVSSFKGAALRGWGKALRKQ